MDNTAMYQVDFEFVIHYFSIDFYMDGFPFIAGFPILGAVGEWGEYFPLPQIIRIVFSVLWYAFLLGIIATLPLCIAKRFKSKVFFLKYRVFWFYGAFIFTSLTAMLRGLVPFFVDITLYAFLKYIAPVYFITLCVTLLPAYIQYKYYNRS